MRRLASPRRRRNAEGAFFGTPPPMSNGRIAPQSETRLLDSARRPWAQGLVPCAPFWVATEVGVTVGAASPINSTSALAGVDVDRTAPATPFRNQRFPDPSTAIPPWLSNADWLKVVRPVAAISSLLIPVSPLSGVICVPLLLTSSRTLPAAVYPYDHTWPAPSTVRKMPQRPFGVLKVLTGAVRFAVLSTKYVVPAALQA